MRERSAKFSALLLFTLAALFGVVPAPAQARLFTVSDSIALVRFSDPNARFQNMEGKISPDRKTLFVITTKGVLAKNQIESSLWIYSTAEVERYLRTKGGRPPKPRLLFSIDGSPIAQQDNSYGSLITRAQWASDSQSILALVERPGGSRHILRIPLSRRPPTDMTPGDGNVTEFSAVEGTIAYLVVERVRPMKIIGTRINDASSDLTGLRLLNILFPKIFLATGSNEPVVDLWVRYRGKNKQINTGWDYPSSAGVLRLALSPNGRELIAAQPVTRVPAQWSRYKVADSIAGFVPAVTGTDGVGRGLRWPWTYVHVDLNTMKVSPLVDAPAAFPEGYDDVTEAKWSKDGAAVLFASSYLPLSDTPKLQTIERRMPCAAAVYRVRTKSADCVAFSLDPKSRKYLLSAEFGQSMNEVILHWMDGERTEAEFYEQTQKGWRLRLAGDAAGGSQRMLKVFIRQDINLAPTLWAKAGVNAAKFLWNPNPQLQLLDSGVASVYTWKDSTGYEWHAGLLKPYGFTTGHRYPLVIQTHGFYNEREFLVDGSFTTGFAARPLAAAGIVVLQMEDRADRHNKPAPQEAQLAVDGFESAIDHLDQDGLIDPSRVGIVGFSRTAWHVEKALIHAPGRFRAATLIDGVDQSYLTYMLFGPNNSEATLEADAANGGKPFGPGIHTWLKSAAGFNLNKVRTPVRIEAIGAPSILGEWEIYSSLYQQRKPVDFVYIPNGQHILQKPWDRLASQQGNVDWFRFWLQGYEDPDPAKAIQYRRWEMLCSAQKAEQASLPTFCVPTKH